MDLVSDSFEVILMKSVNWWESPCPKWDCFWHDKMQINAAWGLIWLAAQDFELKGENSWEEWNYWGGLGLKLTRNLTMLPARFEKIVVIFDIGTLATQQRGMIRIRKSKFFFLWTRERGKEGYRFLGVWGHFSWKTSTCQEYTYTKRKRNLLRSQHFQSQNKCALC